ncbi:MAG: hypothetical protein U5M50_10455 [Sphingobium sp.]|nr:hypothetical protein [Sphingobium sp.]
MSCAVAGDRLRRALGRSADMAGCGVTFASEISRSWCSNSFTGGRHAIDLLVSGPEARAWLNGLNEDVVRVPGHVLVALDVSSVEQQGAHLAASIEALTIEEA